MVINNQRRTVFNLLSLFLSFGIAIPAVAIEICTRSSRHTCVVDGDTIWFGGINYRLEGYDTPEEFSNVCGGFTEIDLARAATLRLLDLLD